jgi:hypothetical protein
MEGLEKNLPTYLLLVNHRLLGGPIWAPCGSVRADDLFWGSCLVCHGFPAVLSTFVGWLVAYDERTTPACQLGTGVWSSGLILA